MGGGRGGGGGGKGGEGSRREREDEDKSVTTNNNNKQQPWDSLASCEMVCSSLGVFRQSAEGFRRRLLRLSPDDGGRRRRDRDTGIPTDHGVVTLEGGGGGGVLFRDTGYAGWEVRCVELGIGRVLGVDATPLVPGVVARRNEDDDDGEGSGGGGGTHRSTFLPSGTSSTSLLHNLTPVTVDHIYHRVWTSLHRVILTGVRGDVWAFGEGLFGGGRWAYERLRTWG